MNFKVTVRQRDKSKSDNKALEFAKDELRRYLERSGCVYCEECENEIALTVADSKELPVKDADKDDGIIIDVNNLCGRIVGTNARSVLIGVYRFLTELGFAFIRPGEDGEFCPRAIPHTRVMIKETADHRHRGICIEGSLPIEAAKDIIDWIPKVSMNSYFIQFFRPRIFFDRWYSHAADGFENPYLEGQRLTDAQIDAFTEAMEAEIEKRHLIYHGVGHGWTCRPFGLEASGWYVEDDSSVSEDVRKNLALVRGKRGLTGGIALNTNLCYGNKEIRERLTDSVVEYCRQKENMDYVHVWLGDGANNNCECHLCKDTRPSDFYVMLLNELDEKLTRAGLNNKIVFLMYVDLLWPPEKETIKNSSRFTFMFAPIDRSYSSLLYEKGDEYRMAEYKRNELTYPKNAAEYMAYYKGWQKAFAGDSFIFDYYYMWDCYKDLGYTDTARLISEDIKSYGTLGFNGLISCQSQRVFIPTALGMHAMARTLWDRECDFESLRTYVHEKEFGEGSAEISRILELLSRYCLPSVARLEVAVNDVMNSLDFSMAIALAESLESAAKRGIASSTERINKDSYSALQIYSHICMMLLTDYKSFADRVEPVYGFISVEEYINKNELSLLYGFDAFEFKRTVSKIYSAMKDCRINDFDGGVR